jgi:hypothetical protein
MQPLKLENTSEKKFTAIEVLYRDAGNYKTWQTYVLEGEVTLERFAPYLEVDNLFIGQDVGIENLMLRERELPLGSDDHPWLELNEVRPGTPAEALQAEEENRFLGPAEELLQRFKTAQEAHWPSEFEVTERIQVARDQTEGAEVTFTPGDNPPAGADSWQQGIERLDKASRALRAHSRRLLAAGFTDQQILEIINTAIHNLGPDVSNIDTFIEAPAAALQVEVDRLDRRETSGAR